MSAERISWLNNMQGVGFVEQPEDLWWFRADDQPEESTIYPGAIPIEDIYRRWFNWDVIEGDFQSTGTMETEDGPKQFTITDPERKTMLRPPGAFGPDDEGAVLGNFKSGYTPHPYRKWLVENIEAILDDELGIGSVGLLRDGAQAYVSVEVPESITTPEGVVFRPRLTATTSFDGSLASTYKRMVMKPICDNTLAAGLSEKGQVYKVKHSRYSALKIMEARDALAVIHTIADDFMAEVAELTAIKISMPDFNKFMDADPSTSLVYLNGPDEGKQKEGRGHTMATKKRDELTFLYTEDHRAAPWTGTAYGVLAAVNTHAHHFQRVLKTERAQRNMLNAVFGKFDELDQDTMTTLMAVVK